MAGLNNSHRELLLTRLILSRKPKCLEAFYQRQWVLDKLFSSAECDSRAVVLSERTLCTTAAERHPNNYHAWNHRLWLLQWMVRTRGRNELLRLEFEGMKAWAEVHVSEHSGLHYLDRLVEVIVSMASKDNVILLTTALHASDALGAYEEMLKFNKSLIVKYPGHEALFYARKTLVFKWKALVCKEIENKVEDSSINSDTQNSVCEEDQPVTNGKGKKKELIDSQSSPRAVKKSCVENNKNSWCSFLMQEKNFAAQCIKEAEFDYQKELAQRYQSALSRIT